jgi:hypothetical protein
MRLHPPPGAISFRSEEHIAALGGKLAIADEVVE